MHRGSVSSTRNSFGFVKDFDSGHHANLITGSDTDPLNVAIPDDDASFPNSNRILYELPSLMVDDILATLLSPLSESRLCTVDWKASPRRGRNLGCPGISSPGHFINVTETAEDVTESTTTACSMSDVVDDVIEANQLQFVSNLDNEICSSDTKSLSHDEDCDDATHQSIENVSSIPSIHEEERRLKTTAALQMSTIDAISSNLRSIKLLNDEVRIDHKNKSTRQIVQDYALFSVSRRNYDDESGFIFDDENDTTKLNENDLLQNTKSCDKAISLDHTFHESRQFSNIVDVDISSCNSDGCWTEEECGTATSSDFLVLPIIHNNEQKCSNRNISSHLHPLRQGTRVNIERNDNDDHHQSCGRSSIGSSSGCSIHLSTGIRSCQSSVTWYEGSNIDEIDISSKQSDNDDDDDTLSLSSLNPEMYSTFT